MSQVDVSSQAFEGLGVEGSFTLSRVRVTSVPFLAFALDQVGSFVIMESHVGRVTMAGFRIQRCGEFNVLKENRWRGEEEKNQYTGCPSGTSKLRQLSLAIFGTPGSLKWNTPATRAHVQP